LFDHHDRQLIQIIACSLKDAFDSKLEDLIETEALRNGITTPFGREQYRKERLSTLKDYKRDELIRLSGELAQQLIIRARTHAPFRNGNGYSATERNTDDETDD
jgi:hypothetical protein